MRRLGVMVAMAALAVAGCGRPPELRIVDPWVRAPAAPGNPGAAYFTIEGGAADETLIAVDADVAVRAEMHESMGGPGQMAGMKAIAQVTVPARTAVDFKPGGRHVMLFDMNPGLRRDAKVTLRFTFADGTVLESNAPWVTAGQPSPS